MVYVITGGAGAPLQKAEGGAGLEDFTAISSTRHQLLVVDVTDDILTMRAVDTQGRLFDSFTMDKSSPGQACTTSSTQFRASTFVVCPSGTTDTAGCDFVNSGNDGRALIQGVVDSCPYLGCTVVINPGTIHFTSPRSGIALSSNTRFELRDGATINFWGTAPGRYAFEVDGTISPITDVFVGGPGVISVRGPDDSGIRIRGDA